MKPESERVHGNGLHVQLAYALICLALATSVLAQEPNVIWDFEDGALGDWVVAEGAFGQIVSNRPEYHHHGGAYRKHGEYFLSTLESPKGRPDDRYQGVVMSPVFVLRAPTIKLMVGGGNHETTYVALCTLDGKEHARGQGKKSQTMQDVVWTVPDLVGKSLYIKVVDHHASGWGHITLDHILLTGEVDRAATVKFREALAANRASEHLRKQIAALKPEALKAMIEDLATRYSESATHVGNWRRELTKIETELLELQKTATSKTDLERITSRIEALKRLLVRQHPLLSRQPLCFVERQQYLKDHHNTATLFQKGEINAGSFRGGGALKALDTQTGQCRTILKTDTGVIRDPEMSFDGRRVLFSMRRDKDDDYHIYEIGSDGSELRQLTRLSGISDIDPLYLPDGGIVFSSTREPKYCMCNRHIMCNLFRMDGDGVNIRQIGKSTLFEGHSSLLSDGRILYDRWEYVDRNFGDAQGLWTVNPDGTNHAVYWGNNTASPGGVLEGRQIPGTQQIVCTLGSCHDRPWGAIGIIDRAVGIDGPKPILRTWPATAHKLAGTGNYDQFKRVSPKYEDPYPLSEKYFLCARTVGDGDRTAIFLVDVFGNDLLVHESDTGCFDPMPLAPRAKPPIIPARRNYRNQDGFLYVADVHEGTHMAGVKRGSAAFLRVIESPEKRYWSSASWGGQGVHCPAMNWHSFENKRILGTVPVAADGSAYVQVPADRFVFFQLLDKRGMMIQSMRSGTMVQSGETTGCIGCHEPRLAAPRPGKRHALRAAEQPPATLDGWYGAPRVISFQKEIQPIFDRNCVSCHDFGKPAGKKLLLAGDREITFCASYVDLWRTKAIRCVGGGPAAVQQAYSWGSHASKLIKVLDKGHNNVKLSPEERARLVTWIDLNAPYYPTYASAYPNNLTGRCPLNKAQLAQLSALTNTNFSALARHSKKQRVTLSFDRPELSPCLLPLGENPTAHAQALAVIRTGQAALQARPRADMDDFVPCQKDAERLCKYAASQAREKANRQAVIAGGKRYDTDSVPVED